MVFPTNNEKDTVDAEVRPSRAKGGSMVILRGERFHRRIGP